MPNRRTRSTLALASPLFVLNFRLYSGLLEKQLLNNCFQLNSPPANLDYLPRDVLILLSIAARYQMRIGELLGIICEDFIGHGRWLVRGLKKSRNYVIYLETIQLADAPRTDSRWRDPLIPVGYDYVYKWCCRAGIGGTLPGRKTNVRTHAHRYKTALAISAVAGERAAGDALHHNAAKSIKSYTKREVVDYGKNSKRNTRGCLR